MFRKNYKYMIAQGHVNFMAVSWRAYIVTQWHVLEGQSCKIVNTSDNFARPSLKLTMPFANIH
jgi:hypothetical protein